MPMLIQSLQQSSGRIGLWKITESYDFLLNTAIRAGFSILDQANYKSQLKQKQWLAARCLLALKFPAQIYLPEVSLQSCGALSDSPSS